MADAVKNQTGQQGAVLLSVEAGFGFKTAGKEQNQNYRQSRESSLKAGGDINIRSREGDITVQGSNITAGDTIRLDSARDIRLLSAQDSQHQDGKNRNAGVQVGVGVSVGAQTGVYIYAEAAYGKGKNRSDSQTHQNTLLQSDKLQLSSKGNTVLNGAQAHAKRIDAEVGGTLYIESPQDTVEQESKQSGGGIRAQVALGTAWSVSGNYNQSKASGYSRSVGSQSGLFAGEGGYHITADSVRLKGGAIASAADKDHNELTARSFSFEDIRNESSYSTSSMGIGADYGGSLKGSDGFNQSAFGRASQTAGQNMNKGLNYSPTLPQHESGGSQGYTRSVLSEGKITIGGQATSARALGIQTDLQNAHRSAEAVPDLQNLLDKQQTIAQSTAAIHSAVGTYRGNRAKAAAEELEKQQAAYEGRLKEQNDGSYEQYAGKSDSERLAMRLGNAKYAQAYQEARSWGVGGSKSRALTAAETLITGALGGQGDLQLAANTLAPYAAAAIGKRFGHGEHKNEAAQAISHFMLGAALAYANGADPLAGGSAAVAAERAAEYLAKQYDDGRTAIDPITGKFNPNLLPEHIKEEIKAQTGVIASVVGAAGGSLKGGSKSSTNGTNINALFNAQVGGVLGQNAVENNYLSPGLTIPFVDKEISPDQIKKFGQELEENCGKTGNKASCAATYDKWKNLSYKQGGLDPNDTSWENFVALMYQQEVLPLCKGNKSCEAHVVTSMQLNVVLNAGDAAGLRDSIEVDRRAVNIANGNWVRAGLDTLGDVSTILGMRAMVNPNSAYSKLMNSVFATPSKTGMPRPTTQLGIVGNINAQTINQVQQQTGIKLVFDKTQQIWKTPAGLDYSLGSIHGNRIKHVLAHAIPDPKKRTHTVFNVPRNQILPLIDEAWKKRGLPVFGDPGAYVVNMGRQVGTKGETFIRIIVVPNTGKIISAYPVIK